MNKDTSTIEPWLNKDFVCDCGRRHVIPLHKVVIEEEAIQQIPEYFRTKEYTRVVIVADEITFGIAGSAVQTLLELHHIQVTVSLIQPNETGDVAADEPSIVQVLLDMSPSTQALLAVGSGTIHDIVRFVSSKVGCAFVSIPTAPSVDGFASVGAPLLVRGFKQTVPACAPEAIFADLSILSNAPREMIAAGFGDMLGKYTSMADWKLGRTLFQEYYCPLAAEMTYSGLQKCIDHVEDISNGSPYGMQMLMEGLILSGISMLMVGNSRPASGAEHHLSHYWEMKFVQQGRKALLHGAKVGVACVMMAGEYDSIKSLTKEGINRLLSVNAPPTKDADRRQIIDAYGKIAGQVLLENSAVEQASGDDSYSLSKVQSFKENLLKEWDQIIQIAEEVPSSEQVSQWLEIVGAPVTPGEIGIDDLLVKEAMTNALFVRNRFTILRLKRWFHSEDTLGSF